MRGSFFLQPLFWPLSRWYVSASIDGWRWQRQSFNTVEDCNEQLPSDSHFGKLERHVFRVPGHLRPDLDELLPERCQRPVLHITGQGKPTQEVGQVVRLTIILLSANGGGHHPTETKTRAVALFFRVAAGV